MGYDIRRVKNFPLLTLCGLRSLPIRTVIDVGANTGQFARYISRFFPQAEIYCIEPLPEPFKELKKWAETQNGRVSLLNLAIGDHTGTTEMYLHCDHSPSSSVLASTRVNESYYPFLKRQKKVPVTVTTLDLALKDTGGLKEEIIVKIDVQGYENRVVQGGQEILQRAKACILEINLDTLYQGQADFRDLVSKFYELGFVYGGNLEQVYAEDGHVIFLDAVFRKQ